MATSLSEEYLGGLAERSFLKLWTIPNPYRSPGKEVSDLIVVFGDDVVIFSDKACEFKADVGLELAWSRWKRDAIDGSVKQLAGAARKLALREFGPFTDRKAKEVYQYHFPTKETWRLHLIGIARPSLEPGAIPPEWEGLTYVGETSSSPFEVEPLKVEGKLVHIFDGATIDLLLSQLDTAPDFISYLVERERTLSECSGYTFAEPDRLATAIKQWGDNGKPSIGSPDLDTIRKGSWNQYIASRDFERTRELNGPSRAIDRLLEHFHHEFETNGFIGSELRSHSSHESALRLLAGENRFSRRVVAHELWDILGEQDKKCFWISTISSPTKKDLRYVWVAYPQPPEEESPGDVERTIEEYLSVQILAVCADFDEPLVVGIAVPNTAASETVYIMKVFDGSYMTEGDKREAKKTRDQVVCSPFAPQTRLHSL